MDADIGQALLVDTQQIWPLARGMGSTHDSQRVLMLHRPYRGRTHPGQPKNGTQPKNESDRDEVEVITASLSQIVFAFVEQNAGQFSFHE